MKKYKNVILYSVLILAIGYIGWMKFSPKFLKKKYTDKQAWGNASEYIANRMKSPSSVKFKPPVIGKVNDASYIISGLLEATNGFGGYGKLYYSVVVEFTPDDMVHYSNVIIDNE